MRRWILLAMLLCLPISGVFAQGTQPATAQATQSEPAAQSDAVRSDDVVDLDTIVVSGAQPGPGLWKVSNGDHVLWILGTLSPLPRRMQWQSERVERVIASSQEVLASPSVELDANVGVVRGLFLLPSLFRARRNPDGRSLQQVVSAAEYARWQVLKARYIGRDRGIEQWRPVFAALELYEKAIVRSGLSQKGVVAPVVKSTGRRHKVKITEPKVEVNIPNAKQTLREFSEVTLDDGECFRKTLDRIETDLDRMAARANAWAIGDIDALRGVPEADQYAACVAAFTEASLARRVGIDDMPRRVRDAWMAAAESALQRNASTFATLPIVFLLRDDDIPARLRAKGYEVQAP
jgi:hypothetical protein